MKAKLKTSERIGIALILIFLYFILFSCGNTKNKKSDYVRLKDRPTYATEVKDTFVDSKGKVWLNSRYVCPPCDCDKGIIQIIAENRTERIKERQDGRNYRSDNRNDRKENKQNKKAETKINNSDNKAETKQNKSNNKVDKTKVKQDGKTDRKWAGWLNGLMLGLGLGIIITIFVSWWIGAYRRKENKVDNKSEPCIHKFDSYAFDRNGSECCEYCGDYMPKCDHTFKPLSQRFGSAKCTKCGLVEYD